MPASASASAWDSLKSRTQSSPVLLKSTVISWSQRATINSVPAWPDIFIDLARSSERSVEAPNISASRPSSTTQILTERHSSVSETMRQRALHRSLVVEMDDVASVKRDHTCL